MHAAGRIDKVGNGTVMRSYVGTDPNTREQSSHDMLRRMTAPPPLAYAPRPPLPRRRWATRVLVAAAVATVAAVSPHWWPPLSRHVRLLYWQHRCLTHPIAGGAVVLQYRDLEHETHEHSADWLTFYRLIVPPGSPSQGTLFADEMRRPDGQWRLVTIDVHPSAFPSDACMYADYRVSKPGTLLHDPIDVASLGDVNLQETPTELRAAFLDPRDPTHFTFDCVNDAGKTDPFDGWLYDDDRIEIRRRPRGDLAGVRPPSPPAETAEILGPVYVPRTGR